MNSPVCFLTFEYVLLGGLNDAPEHARKLAKLLRGRLALLNVIGPWGWIGVVPLATAALGWCPLYTVLGINTCGLKKG